jgi:SAM-dependent methyltransferase
MANNKKRWLAAQELEKRGIENADDMEEWIQIRRKTWSDLVYLLKDDITIDDSTRILDIGCGPTSVFLGLRKGQKYAADPNLKLHFELHPWIKDVEEYKDVSFIPENCEEINTDQKFDLIFTINMLDHINEVKPFIAKIGELLSPSGNIVVLVDCYADAMVSKIMTFFDVDLPHPHHFITQDIIKMFSGYKLQKQDDKVFRIFENCDFKGKKHRIEIYRIDKLFMRMNQILKEVGKQKDILFIIKYFTCYVLALLTAIIRRKESPVHPLKKIRLFIFQKL